MELLAPIQIKLYFSKLDIMKSYSLVFKYSIHLLNKLKGTQKDLGNSINLLR